MGQYHRACPWFKLWMFTDGFRCSDHISGARTTGWQPRSQLAPSEKLIVNPSSHELNSLLTGAEDAELGGAPVPARDRQRHRVIQARQSIAPRAGHGRDNRLGARAPRQSRQAAHFLRRPPG